MEVKGKYAIIHERLGRVISGPASTASMPMTKKNTVKRFTHLMSAMTPPVEGVDRYLLVKVVDAFEISSAATGRR